MRFHVPEMSCGHCTAAITREIQKLDPSATVETDLASRTVDVDTSHAASAVVDAIKAAGYETKPA